MGIINLTKNTNHNMNKYLILASLFALTNQHYLSGLKYDENGDPYIDGLKVVQPEPAAEDLTNGAVVAAENVKVEVKDGEVLVTESGATNLILTAVTLSAFTFMLQ